MASTALGVCLVARSTASPVWSLCPCVSSSTSNGPGSVNSSGTPGLPVTQGSISTRLPPGVSMIQVACPTHVSRSPFPSPMVIAPCVWVRPQTTEGAGSAATCTKSTGMTITSAPRTATVGALLAVAAGLIAPNNLIAFYLTALAAAMLLFAAFLAYLDAAQQLDARNGLA